MTNMQTLIMIFAPMLTFIIGIAVGGWWRSGGRKL